MPSNIIFKTTDFSCLLKCGRCTFTKVNGQQCKNRVCFGTPVCWIHTKQLYGLRIKPSTVYEGKGLFTERLIAADTWICPYIGELINEQCLNLRYPGDMTAPYVIATDNSDYIDSACTRGIGSMSNGKFKNDGFSQSLRSHNAIIDTRDTNELWLKSTKNIHARHEIFVYYGTEYHLEDTHVTKRTSGDDTRPC